MGFITGEFYTRKEVRKILGLEPEKTGGNWSTGYVKQGDSYYLFINLSVAGRTGHDYANELIDDDHLRWESKGNHNFQSNTVQELISGDFNIYLFSRVDSKNPEFTYLGRGRFESLESSTEAKPARIIWKIIK